jgi:hypothetical protein
MANEGDDSGCDDGLGCGEQHDGSGCARDEGSQL